MAPKKKKIKYFPLNLNTNLQVKKSNSICHSCVYGSAVFLLLTSVPCRPSGVSLCGTPRREKIIITVKIPSSWCSIIVPSVELTVWLLSGLWNWTQGMVGLFCVLWFELRSVQNKMKHNYIVILAIIIVRLLFLKGVFWGSPHVHEAPSVM